MGSVEWNVLAAAAGVLLWAAIIWIVWAIVASGARADERTEQIIDAIRAKRERLADDAERQQDDT